MTRAGSFRPMIPQGVQCYFGEEVNRRRKVEAVLAGIMKAWGFEEIILPFFDFLEDFSYGMGAHLGDRVYRFLDKDGSLLALRPDLTTLVAKTVATRMSGQPLPIRLFYSGEVFRQERAGAGRQKEFYQIGLELIGMHESWADAEILLIAIDCLLRLGVADFKAAIGHAGFFAGILAGLQLDAARAAALHQAMDHKDCAWLEEELNEISLPAAKRKFLIELPNFAGGRDVLQQAMRVVKNERSFAALQHLIQLGDIMAELGLEQRITFDLAEVRGLDYYTGLVFKIYSGAAGFELGGGGRYDGLLAKFGWDLPSIGFSLTLDRLLPLVADASVLDVPVQDGEPVLIDAGRLVPSSLFKRVWKMRRRSLPVRIGRRA